MTPLVVAVFLASVLGGLHCVGMCGSFLVLAVSPAPAARTISPTLLHAAYHLGRLVTYCVLGAAAGSIGAAADAACDFAGFSRIAAPIAAGCTAAFGAAALLRHFGAHLPRLPVPPFLSRLVCRSHRLTLNRSPLPRSLLIGMLTTLLPCGWLYLFALTAAAAGGPARGSLVMLVFWIGTLPALASLGVGLSLFGPRLRSSVRPIAAAALVIVGVLSAASRLAPLAVDAAVAAHAPSGPAGATSSPSSLGYCAP